MAMASSSCAAASSLSLKKYDIFISFRGEDTRAGFTSHLYEALCRSKIHTYIDNRIEKGDEVWAELVKAIKDSTLFLVVFSENYASSTWCLNELVEIMECYKNEQDNVVVIPVFYQVEPSHVRKQTGSYHTGLSKHKNQGKDKMKKWKDALFEASNLSGFHSTAYRTEAVLIEDIIELVLGKLKNNYRQELTSDFIFDENYWKVESLIKTNSTKVQSIGLWGMGGMGKTTLASAIFQNVSFEYEGSCFIESVTEESNRRGINKTFNNLLKQLLNEDLDIDTPKAIPPMIMRRLKRMKAFIVLDDVRSLELLQYLIGVGCGWLGAGSTVIVTTRDKHVLESGGINKILEVKKMNSQNSLQLFSLAAFNKLFPKEGYVELSKTTIDYANGNPLALKVLGSFLHCKSEIEWNSALAKLKEIPNTKIDKTLRWSYTELDHKDQNIFLDIACFFKGHERDKITKILNNCGFFANIGIRNLLDKSLMRVDLKNCIQMHDLIQEMGKQIVREESLDNPGQRSRLWDLKEVCDVLKNNRGTEIIQAICLDATEYTRIHLSPKIFEKMSNLRLLAFQDHKETKPVSLPHGLDSLPESLRYFVWDGYPWKSLPSNFCPEMLVELSLQNSQMKKLWNGVLNLSNLEVLNLRCSKKLIECPNVSGSPNLKYVMLDNCKSLPEVDSSIFLLQKLEKLNVYGCTSLKSLVSNTCSPSLITLNALDCINLQDFSVPLTSVGGLNLGLSKWGVNELSSSILHIKNIGRFVSPICDSLADLPENFAYSIMLFRSLKGERDTFNTLHKVLPCPAFLSIKHLTIHSVLILFEIPETISFLVSLELLILSDLPIRSLPETILHLPQLKYVSLLNCNMLQSTPTFTRFIRFFIVFNCESLEKMLSSTIEPSKNPNLGFVLLNCIKLDPHSYQTVLKDAIVGIELKARLNSENEDASLNYYVLPAMHGIEYWFSFRSKQVSFTLELPPDLLGFAYYLVVSQGHIGHCLGFGCECYLDNSSGEKICITSFKRTDSIDFFDGFWTDYNTPIHVMSDHAILWDDPVKCKEIMETVEEIKVIPDVNNTSYNPKLTFTFFIDDTSHDEVEIKECGLRWIYQEETVSSTSFESHDDEEDETIRPRKKLKQANFGTPRSKSTRLKKTPVWSSDYVMPNSK